MESLISPFHLFGSESWYTSPETLLTRDDAHPLGSAPLPDGWQRHHRDVWVHFSHNETRLPQQGWKIHVSCTPHDYERTVDTVWDVCRRNGWWWKFIGHPRLHHWCNGKGTERSFSGKAFTIYPGDEQQLKTALETLAERLDGVSGPYILSDLRWENTSLYVRYGAFSTMWCTDRHGRRVPALRGSDGSLEPDVRGPVFTPPSWLNLPEWLAAGTGFETRPGRRTAKTGKPVIHGYTVLRALHFSNAGGVYLAADPDGRQVVLKEARPRSGLDAAGRDAVERLQHEHDVLQALAGHEWAPAVLERFEEWEHHYLVLEYLEGESLQRMAAKRNPMVRPSASEQDRLDYRDLMRPLLDRVEHLLAQLHELGYAFRDLHTQNIIVSPDHSRVSLVDFELAEHRDTPRSSGLQTPGFASEAPLNAEASDWYAFASCQLAVFAPYNFIAHLNRGALTEGVAALAEHFGFTESETTLMRTRLGLTQPTEGAGIDTSSSALLSGILESANPLDERRLYPADPDSLNASGALGLATGASGVMLGLSAAEAAIPLEHVEWCRRSVETAPTDVKLGLYDGLAGAALVLHRLGDRAASAAVDRITASEAPESLGLYSGRTGIVHLYLELQETALAVKLAESICADLDVGTELSSPGALHGHAGLAMLFAKLARATGDRYWVDRYLTMIEQEIGTAVTSDDAVMMWSGRKLIPYLGGGTAGLAMALLSGHEWLTEAHRDVLGKCLNALDIAFTIEAGLFRGRLGIAYTFAQASRIYPEYAGLAVTARDRVHTYIAKTASMTYPALIGRESHRFSLDLATGSAGALLVDRTLQNPGSCQLPGFELETRPET